MSRFIYVILLVILLQLCNLSICERKTRSTLKNCEKSWTEVSGTHQPKEICSGDLIFEDQFDFFDFKKWKHENTLSGGGNWEFQWYTNNRTNSFVKTGQLNIIPTLTSDVIGEENLYQMRLDINGQGPADVCTDERFYGCIRTGTKDNILNPIRSAKISTIDSFSFKYGKVEVRAKMPTGDWLWPAIWLLPRYNAYGSWPSSGEIDMVEARGNRKLILDNKNIGVEQIGSTLHWGPFPAKNAYQRTNFGKNSPGDGFNKVFRKYELEWTPDFLKFSVDGVELGTVEPQISFWDLGEFNSTNFANPWKYGTSLAPFDQEFYLIINLAVGGTGFFPDNAVNENGKPWVNTGPRIFKDFWENRKSWLPTWQPNEEEGTEPSLQIDYVKIWAI